MSTKHAALFAALAKPFGGHEVKQRMAPGGRQLSYISGRSAMNRLDEVVGPENWRDTYSETKDGLKCRLEVRMPDGEWIWKEDGGGFAGMADEDDNEKAAFTSAFKRACVKLGIGRHLYNDGIPDFTGDGSTPQAAPARPPTNGHASSPPPHQQHAPARSDNGRVPSSGKGLFAWIKDQEQQHELRILFPLNDWAKAQGISARMVEWPDDFIAVAHQEALRLIRQVQPEYQNQATPAAPAQATRKAGDWMLDKQRNKLTDLIYKMASQNHGVAEAQVSDRQFLDMLNSMALAHPDGEVLADIGACPDTKLLAEYIALAEERLALMNS